MIKKQKYAVIRFLKNGKGVHVVHDIAEGISIMEYAKEQVLVEKIQLFIWIQNLLDQLEYYYQCNYGEVYGHMNPYSIIVVDNNEILLLDTSAEENGMWLGKMQKKKIREIFVREEHVLSIKTDMRDDIYGLGKIIQFIVEKCRTDDKYFIREKQILRKLRKVCLQLDNEPREALKVIKGVSRRLTAKEEKKVGIELQVAAGVILVLGIISCVLWESNRIKNREVDNLQAKIDYLNEQKSELDKEKQNIHMELGMLYLVELENEEEGTRHLKYAKSTHEAAEQYIKIYSYMNKALLTKEDKLKLWNLVDEMLNYMEVEQDYLGYIPIIRACEKIDTAKSWLKIKELSETIKENRQWGKVADSDEKRIEILEYLKKAYEKLGDVEGANEVRKELELLKAS